MTTTWKLVGALVGSTLAVTLAALGTTTWADHDTTWARARRELDRRTTLVAEHVRAVIRIDQLLLDRMADHLHGRDPVAMRGSGTDRQMLRNLLTTVEEVDSLWLYDAAGNAVLSTVEGGIDRLNVADREYFKALKAGAPTFVSPMIWGRVTGGFFFVLSRRLEDAQGRFIGVAMAGVPADRFADFYRRISEDDSVSFLIQKATGDVVVRAPLPAAEPAGGWPIDPGLQSRLGIADGVFRHVSSIDGVDRLYAFRRIDPEGLVVIVGRPVDTLLAPWRYRTALVWGLGGCGIALSLILAILLLRNARREAGVLGDALRAVKESEERFDLAVAATDQGIWDWNLLTGHVKRTARMKALCGFTDDEMGNRSREFWDLVHPDDKPVLRAAVREHLEHRSDQVEEKCRILHADGTTRWLLIRGRAQFGADGVARRMVGMMTDITECKLREADLQAAHAAAEEEKNHARHAANHDALTGLPNRAYLSAHIAALAADREQNGTQRGGAETSVAVLVLDLDGFKEVNDSLGHPVGDQVLVAIAQRLKGCLRDGDFAARLGGDEFAILMIGPSADAVRNAAGLSNRLIATVGRDIDVDGHIIRIGCSIGVALCPPAALDADPALKQADAALYRAKRAGKGRMAFHDDRMEDGLEDGLEDDQDGRDEDCGSPALRSHELA